MKQCFDNWSQFYFTQCLGLDLGLDLVPERNQEVVHHQGLEMNLQANL